MNGDEEERSFLTPAKNRTSNFWSIILRKVRFDYFYDRSGLQQNVVFIACSLQAWHSWRTAMSMVHISSPVSFRAGWLLDLSVRQFLIIS